MSGPIDTPIDILALADFRRDELKNMSSCPKCGSPDPARLGDGHCSDCGEFPRCEPHGAWLPCRACLS